MKNKKFVKPLVILLVVIAVIAAAVMGISNYLGSRGVLPTMEDIMATVKLLANYLIALGVIVGICIIIAIASFWMKKEIRSVVRVQSGVAAILAIVIVVNMICMGPEYSILNNVLGDRYSLQDMTIEESKQLVQDIANEGIVLLKNEGNALPLDGVSKLNVFGWSSTNPIYGGTGSGAVDSSKCISFLKGLEDAGYELNTAISDFYTDFCTERPVIGMRGQDWTIPEPTMKEFEDAGIFENAKEFSDTALVVIGRSGGENADLPATITDEDTFEYAGGFFGYTGVRYTSYADDVDPSRSYLELSNREQAMVDKVCQEFNNVVVVINSANAMELGWLDEYDSIKGALWMAGPGQTGFESLGKILNGTVNPSGKLVDTYVYDLHMLPSYAYVGNYAYDYVASNAVMATDTADWLSASFTNYVEGIYVGYKYFETAAAEGIIDYDSVVQYPFGYGLSYTEFEQKITDVKQDETTVTLQVSVTNTGDTAGKDVVEVYYNPPYTNGGIEKASANLLAFEKTEMMEPGQKTDITISFDLEEMASYDDRGIKAKGGAYVLEQGEYVVSINKDSHNVIDSTTITVDADVIYNDENDGKRQSDAITATNQFDFAKGDVEYLSRADGFANYEAATAAPTDFSFSDIALDGFYCQNTYDSSEYDAQYTDMPATGKDNGLTIRDMTGLAYDDEKWEQLLDELSIDEMNKLIGLGGYQNVKVESIDLPATIECDGPAAIKNNYTGESGTAYPAATMIAATWNKELARERGESMGQQCEDMNVCGWYGPAMNIHRTPFSGRNFEYYSEDGVLSGYMGAAEVAGAKKYGIQCYIKHFALNDSEGQRLNALCTWTNEQAMREIYLKPFEISVKLGGASNAMTAFNYIGNVWAGTCDELLQTVLRGEWGFTGSTVSDWFHGATDGFMLANAAVRNGGDKMLCSAGDAKANVTDTDKAGTVVAMRESSHNILYSLANSNAMDERNFKTPGWVKGVVAADVVIILLLGLWEVMTVRAYRKNKKVTE